MVQKTFLGSSLNSSDNLIWFDSWGVGYYPVRDNPYNEDYFEKYVGYEKTDIGKQLNQARIDLVNRHGANKICDIGIGSGMFLKSFPDATGFDINPIAVKWLRENGRWMRDEVVDSMTFWDSLEHIHNPTKLLSMVGRFAFVSCPIYRNQFHVLRSKHFRPDEHCWYFTFDGAVAFMQNFRFRLIEFNTMEQDLGREDIGTFVFKRF